jgi:hypothetical protein
MTTRYSQKPPGYDITGPAKSLLRTKNAVHAAIESLRYSLRQKDSMLQPDSQYTADNGTPRSFRFEDTHATGNSRQHNVNQYHTFNNYSSETSYSSALVTPPRNPIHRAFMEICWQEQKPQTRISPRQRCRCRPPRRAALYFTAPCSIHWNHSHPESSGRRRCRNLSLWRAPRQTLAPCRVERIGRGCEIFT